LPNQRQIITWTEYLSLAALTEIQYHLSTVISSHQLHNLLICQMNQLRYIMGSNAVKSYTKSKGGKQSFPKLLNKQYKVKIDEPTTKN